MREIKFRIWDKTDKTMNYFPNDKWEAVYFDGKKWEFPKQVPMEFSGLKDKNGQDIYEGDIVKFVDDDETIFREVVFGFGYFGLFRGLKMKPALLYPYPVEVAGNIYENPDLLK